MGINDYMQDAGLRFRGSLRRRTITVGIVLHHAAARTLSPQQVHSIHTGRGWAGAGYHVYVRKDGSVWSMRPLWAVGAHAAASNAHTRRNNNSQTIGVCAEGMYHASSTQAFDRQMPDEQYKAVLMVVKDIMAEYPSIKWIRGHNEMPGVATVCPGEFFPLASIQRAK